MLFNRYHISYFLRKRPYSSTEQTKYVKIKNIIYVTFDIPYMNTIQNEKK